MKGSCPCSCWFLFPFLLFNGFRLVPASTVLRSPFSHTDLCSRHSSLLMVGLAENRTKQPDGWLGNRGMLSHNNDKAKSSVTPDVIHAHDTTNKKEEPIPKMYSDKPFKRIYCIKSCIYQDKYQPSERDKENRLKCKERRKAKLQNTYIL